MEPSPDYFAKYLPILILVVIITGLSNASFKAEYREEPYIPLSRCFVKAPNKPFYYVEKQVLGVYTDAIIECESMNNTKAYNQKSKAKGLCQVVPSSEEFCEQGLEEELDMFNPEDNLRCAEYLYQHGGLEHWAASEECWKKIYK